MQHIDAVHLHTCTVSTFLTSEHHAKLLKHGGMSLELEWHVALRQCLRAMACGAYMHLQTIAFAKCR